VALQPDRIPRYLDTPATSHNRSRNLGVGMASLTLAEILERLAALGFPCDRSNLSRHIKSGRLKSRLIQSKQQTWREVEEEDFKEFLEFYLPRQQQVARGRYVKTGVLKSENPDPEDLKLRQKQMEREEKLRERRAKRRAKEAQAKKLDKLKGKSGESGESESGD
jgi:hypothetical protein